MTHAVTQAKPESPTGAPKMSQRQVLEALSGLLLGMFVSILAGTVVSVQDHMRGFVLKITQIAHSNARSTATNPNAAVGHEVAIDPTVTKDKNGNFSPDERELNYIKSLEKGQSIQIDVINTDTDHLRIANLTTAEKQQAKQEKKADKKKD